MKSNLHHLGRDAERNLFLPSRFVFDVGGGPGEGFTPEGAEGGGGVSEAASEALAEELRNAAAGQRRDSKREQKAKKQDKGLADLIAQFIRSGSQNDAILLLIARLLERNTPIAVVVAILSLVYTSFREILAEYVTEEHIPKKDESFDVKINAIVPLGQDVTNAMDAWADVIFTHASFHPLQTITALAHHEGVNSSCLQLTAFMMQQFLEQQGQQPEFNDLRRLSDVLWRSMLKKVHKICDDQNLLSAPESSERENENTR